jgi:hypothetical protein
MAFLFLLERGRMKTSPGATLRREKAGGDT